MTVPCADYEQALDKIEKDLEWHGNDPKNRLRYVVLPRELAEALLQYVRSLQTDPGDRE